MTPPVLTAYDWVPDFARGLVRDLPVRWALEEAGRAYTVRALPQGSQKGSTHRALQPFGQVPTYQEGDLVLFESGAIVLHIAQSADRLLPVEPTTRARAIQWMFAALNSVELPIADFGTASFFERDASWSQERLPLVRDRVAARLDDLATRLADAEWLDGSFTAGDLMMVCVLRPLRGSGLLEAQPALAAYVARGEARPAFKRALDAQMQGFTGSPPTGWTAMLQTQGEDA
jgi:glutathione S-transferase